MSWLEALVLPSQGLFVLPTVDLGHLLCSVTVHVLAVCRFR